MSKLFHRQNVGYHETQIGENLYGFSVEPQRALEEYLLQQIRVKPLYDMLFKNRLFQYFAAATPGMRELVTIGKIWELARCDRRNRHASPFDLLIVDAPSTGHGLGFLRTPRTFRDAARVGPISRQAGKIDAFITDPATTGVVAVALPEEMPVNETVDFERQLNDELGMELDAVVVNALLPERFDPAEAERIEQAAAAGGSPGVEAALKAALFEHHRVHTQRAELERLSEELGRRPLTLPFLFEPELDLRSFEVLSTELEAAL